MHAQIRLLSAGIVQVLPKLALVLFTQGLMTSTREDKQVRTSTNSSSMLCDIICP